MKEQCEMFSTEADKESVDKCKELCHNGRVLVAEKVLFEAVALAATNMPQAKKDISAHVKAFDAFEPKVKPSDIQKNLWSFCNQVTAKLTVPA